MGRGQGSPHGEAPTEGPTNLTGQRDTMHYGYFDALVNACTAFRTGFALYQACREGYIPTLYGRTRRERILRRVLRAINIQVYPR